MGIHRAGQRATVGHNRVESLANDYSSWGVAPHSPTYSGLSPFGSYQQFSPLPHHQAPQSYPHYPFSATAPDLSAALNVSPYTMSPPAFSNTVNVGHLLPEQQAGPYSGTTGQSSSSMGKTSSVPGSTPTVSSQNPPGTMPNPVWPPTSAEMSSVIDRELFGYGLDSGAANYPYQSYYPYPGMQGGSIDQMQQARKEGTRSRNSEQPTVKFSHETHYGPMDGQQQFRQTIDCEDANGTRPKILKNKTGK